MVTCYNLRAHREGADPVIDHLINQIPTPIIFAHRGASRYAPENTLSAFQLAFEQGARAIELDVKLSKDEEVVVFHDLKLDRTTNGKGLLKNFTFDELNQLDAGSYFHQKFCNEKIPTLSQVLDLVDGKYLINIELTNYSTLGDELISKVVVNVKKKSVQHSIIFSSFSSGNIIKIKHAFPEVPAALLTPPGFIGIIMQSDLYRRISPEFIHINIQSVKKGLIDREHRRHRRVNVWTVNEESQMQYLVSAGADGFFTDDPPLALQVIGKNQ